MDIQVEHRRLLLLNNHTPQNLVIELFDVKLSMLGSHQLQNVATTTCAFLCLRDQAYTKESAKALADTIQMTFPKAKLFLVVAMESDKDHLGFTRELLLGWKTFFTCGTMENDSERRTLFGAWCLVLGAWLILCSQMIAKNGNMGLFHV
ncbi:hypothetical protein ACSBR2_023108 [Camellia fascicularis]